MAIKVTKMGKLPEDKVFQGSCSNCKSKMEWLRKDALSHHPETQRDSEFTTIKCPVCDHTVNGY